MIRYLSTAVVFTEFPDEICLALNITGCPCHCEHCSQPELQSNLGTLITDEELDRLIALHPGVTMIGFMGGDSSHSRIVQLADHIHAKGLRVGMYSGLDELDMELLAALDYYKIGAFRIFVGPEETWKEQTAGPICLPTSNQLMFKRIDKDWINITDRFRLKKINNWKSTII